MVDIMINLQFTGIKTVNIKKLLNLKGVLF
jgi:hypothetical protein